MTPVAVLTIEQVEQLMARAVEPLRAELAQLRAALPPSPLVTIEEAARLTGVSAATMRRRIKEGAIPVVRRGRTVRLDPTLLRPPADGQALELSHQARHS